MIMGFYISLRVETSAERIGGARETNPPARDTIVVALRADLRPTPGRRWESMSNSYRAADIEVLSGLDPVRRRPGMYTDTSRPNHLAHEVIDNSVDEAIEGHAGRIEVTLYRDGSLKVADDGRGMPVDIHPEERMPGVELILTRLHAGGKFSNRTYRFSGGLHGVGVSVVNALSRNLEVRIRRGGKEYGMCFAGGERRSELDVVGTVGKADTGTALRFWPDPRYFDTPSFSLRRLKHVLRAKAVLCPGLAVRLEVESPREVEAWQYGGGLAEYLLDQIVGATLPAEPLTGSLQGQRDAVDWALVWLPEEAQPPVAESYVNLVPTLLGGTHVNGLRAGLTEALREFCNFAASCPGVCKHRARKMSGTALPTCGLGKDRGSAVFRADQRAPCPRGR